MINAWTALVALGIIALIGYALYLYVGKDDNNMPPWTPDDQ